MGRATAALRLRTINDNHVQKHKAYHDRLYLAQSVAQKNTRTNSVRPYTGSWAAMQWTASPP